MSPLMAGPALSSGAVLAAVAVAVAVGIAVPHPAGRLGRLGPPVERSSRRIARRQLVAGLAAGLSVWLMAGSILGQFAVVGAAAAAVGAGWFAGRLEPRALASRRRQVADALPVTLELMAACLDAGAPLRSAVAQVAALGPPATADTLSGLDDAVRLGIHEPTAWSALADDPLWGPIALDMARCAATGAAAGEVLREHAEEARQAASEARLEAARAVGVRSVLPLMVCFLPAFLLIGVVPIVASLIPRIWGH